MDKFIEKFSLEGKKAIVTGGAKGLCNGMAQALHDAGAEVVLLDILDIVEDSAKEMAKEGAISENKLTQILNNTNTDTIRQRATPRASTSLSTAKQNRIAALSASGYSTSEIAEALGVSSSTVSKYLNGKE